jgi:hypothetical protein
MRDALSDRAPAIAFLVVAFSSAIISAKAEIQFLLFLSLFLISIPGSWSPARGQEKQETRNRTIRSFDPTATGRV